MLASLTQADIHDASQILLEVMLCSSAERHLPGIRISSTVPARSEVAPNSAVTYCLDPLARPRVRQLIVGAGMRDPR